MTLSDFTIFVETEKRIRGFRLRRYYSDRQILIITLPTDIHEKLHTEIYLRIIKKLFQIGLDEEWTTIGSATRRAGGHPRGNGGESDSSGGPKPDRLAKGAWPTLVIEAGESESLTELHNDMRWWFSTSQHQVKIILLAKLDRSQQAILLQRWEEEASAPRQGATTTRRAAALEPVLRQDIRITRNPSPVSYHVTRGALVLPFHLLFLRAPGPQEGDIVVSIQDLEKYAADVWAVV